MTWAERAIMLVKKVTYFGDFGYLNSSCITKRIILMFLSSSTDKFTFFLQNLETDASVSFWPPYWCSSGQLDGHQHGVSMQISINLGKKFLRIS